MLSRLVNASCTTRGRLSRRGEWLQRFLAARWIGRPQGRGARPQGRRGESELDSTRLRLTRFDDGAASSRRRVPAQLRSERTRLKRRVAFLVVTLASGAALLGGAARLPARSSPHPGLSLSARAAELPLGAPANEVRAAFGRPQIAERVFVEAHHPPLECWYYAVLERRSLEFCFRAHRLALKRSYHGGMK